MSSLSCNSQCQTLEIGDSLDIFILCSKLHKSAMATLFLARDLLSGKKVVLKIPHDDILNRPILLYHYQNEERISRLLDHPGIIGYIHRQRSRQYIIMEYVQGHDLRSMVGRRHRVKLETALTLMINITKVISYLHKKDIVHLDLKPENIICLDGDRIKVIDFGMASCRHLPDLLSCDLKKPQGTPWYIAPEQLLGQRADPCCDIYSMGMLFYEMLTGQLPWPRSSKVQVARRRLHHDPAPPRYYNPAIPPQIQDIILHAIARNPKDRYDSAKALQHDLECWQQLPITAAGRQTKQHSFWKRLFPCKSIPQNHIHIKKNSSTDKPQIIGALIDSLESDNMLVEVKKQALIHSGEVTLVHVIEEENDFYTRRYGIAVEGERLMKRLEEAVQILRRFNIDPNIRLIKGEVVEVLQHISRDLSAQSIVVGVSRKKKGLLGGTLIQHRLEKSCYCEIIVAKSKVFSPFSSLIELQPDQLTKSQVLACDIFLVDLWYEHLHYHTDFIYQKLLHPDQRVDLSDRNCCFGDWLNSFNSSKTWQKATSTLALIHHQFHHIASQMAEQCSNNYAGIQNLLINKSLPLSHRLKNELRILSQFMHAHLDVKPPIIPFFTDNASPFTKRDSPCYGPLLRSFNLQQDLSGLIKKEKSHASFSTSKEKK
jgi:serine/threonine protein kinase